MFVKVENRLPASAVSLHLTKKKVRKEDKLCMKSIEKLKLLPLLVYIVGIIIQIFAWEDHFLGKVESYQLSGLYTPSFYVRALGIQELKARLNAVRCRQFRGVQDSSLPSTGSIVVQPQVNGAFVRFPLLNDRAFDDFTFHL